MNDGESIAIGNGRHPVSCRAAGLGVFVPNDLFLDSGGSSFTIVLTGPEHGRKSTYLRQAALIVILAQMGSFVPAEGLPKSAWSTAFLRESAHRTIFIARSNRRLPEDERNPPRF